jgi:transcriptional regulator with XRE-family HTH domain
MLREARGWTQETFADRANRHWTYIGGVERGERNPTLRVIADLAKALDVSIADLFPNGDR